MPARRRLDRVLYADVSVYVDTVFLGHIRQRGREHVALAGLRQTYVGTFPSRKAAADALSAAALLGRGKAGRTE